MIFNNNVLGKGIFLKFVFLFSLLLGVGGCNYIGNPSVDGVLLASDVSSSSRNYIQQSGVVDLNRERLVAYYDATISLDDSESYILTDKNLVIYCDGTGPWVETLDCLGTDPHNTTVIPLNTITDVYKSDVYYDDTSCGAIMGTCFYVETYYATYFFVIAPWMNADLFIDALLAEL